MLTWAVDGGWWVVIGTPQPLRLLSLFQGKALGVRSRLGGPQSCISRYGEEKGLSLMLGYEPDTLPADSVVHSAYQLKWTDSSVKQLHDVLMVYKGRIFF